MNLSTCIFLLCFLSIAAASCNILHCSDSSLESSNSLDCFRMQDHDIYMQKCSQQCKILISNILNQEGDLATNISSYNECPKQTSSVRRQKYSGEECSSNDQCYSKVCNETCIGIKEGEQCDDTLSQFCQQGYSCQNSKCILLKKINSSCQNSSECETNLFCHPEKLTCTSEGQLEIDQLDNSHQSYSLSVRCSSLLIRSDRKCIESNTDSFLKVIRCQEGEECFNKSNYYCNLFEKDKKYSKNESMPSGFYQYLQQERESLLKKNSFCPKSLEMSAQCTIITELLLLFKEADVAYSFFHRLVNMPTCLLEHLRFPQPYKLLISQYSQTLETSSFGFINFILVFVVIGILLLFGAIGAFFFKKKIIFFKNFQNHHDLPLSNRNIISEKVNSANVSQNIQQQLSLEINPTSNKPNELEISNHLELPPNQKKEGFETSVDQNFFSIDGDDQQQEKEEEQQQQESESIGDSQSESDMSYENVFNLEGENVSKPQRKRRRPTNRKKIVKKDNDNKKYEVVEE